VTYEGYVVRVPHHPLAKVLARGLLSS